MFIIFNLFGPFNTLDLFIADYLLSAALSLKFIIKRSLFKFYNTLQSQISYFLFPPIWFQYLSINFRIDLMGLFSDFKFFSQVKIQDQKKQIGNTITNKQRFSIKIIIFSSFSLYYRVGGKSSDSGRELNVVFYAKLLSRFLLIIFSLCIVRTLLHWGKISAFMLDTIFLIHRILPNLGFLT